MEQAEQERIPYRRQRTGLGECVVVDDLEVVDTYPEVLASLLPVFLDEELTVLKKMPAEDRTKAWARRERAMNDEREWRKLDSSRDVYGKSWDGK
jgi:hypothetical protein